MLHLNASVEYSIYYTAIFFIILDNIYEIIMNFDLIFFSLRPHLFTQNQFIVNLGCFIAFQYFAY